MSTSRAAPFPSVTIITPTIGRQSLAVMLTALAPQLDTHDECLVLGDGPQPAAEQIVAAAANSRIRYIEHLEVRNWGNPQRNTAITIAKGDLLVFIDDDDLPLGDCVATIKRVASMYPGRPLMFKMAHLGSILWRTPKIERGNVSGQMFIAPNVPDRLGRWNESYEADFHYIATTIARYPNGADDVVWREEITTIQGLRPR